MAITNNFPTGGSSSIDLSRTLIASYTTAGTYTWTVPEEIKKKGFVDVYIMGGGGSGGAVAFATAGTDAYTLAMGGASGYTTILNNFPIFNKTSIDIVVGAGAAAVVANSGDGIFSSSYSYSGQSDVANGLTGGTSKFDIYEALGGEGGLTKTATADASASFYRLRGANGGSGSTGVYGGRWISGLSDYLPGANGSNGEAIYNSGANFAEGDSIENYSGKGIGTVNVVNKYATTSIMGAAGGLAMAKLNAAQSQTQPGIGTAYGSSGGGSTNGTGKNATGNGNGGGGTVYLRTSNTATTATSGAGAPGLVLIYG